MKPALNPPKRARYRSEGVVGDRIQAGIRQWLLVAPDVARGAIDARRGGPARQAELI